MKQPRIMVIGRRGQVGFELCRALAPLAELVPVDYPEMDLANADSVRAILRALHPDVIINAAAYTAVDRAESEPDKARQINALAPALLAQEAHRLGAWLVHYSTDCIFDGTKAAAYVEEDAPAPVNVYGRTKAEGDAAVCQETERHLIFRLCWVYSDRGHNFPRTIRRLAMERDRLRVVADQTGCPTWARLIAGATAGAVMQVWSDADNGRAGVYHLAAAGKTSWHGFAQAIVEMMPAEARKCGVVEPVATADYPQAAKRPANATLNCAKLAAVFGLRLPDWRASLADAMEGW